MSPDPFKQLEERLSAVEQRALLHKSSMKIIKRLRWPKSQ
jgi:hypothetical protein